MGLTTKPEPWAALASGTLPESKYEMIVTTPAERLRKIWAGAKPLPASGFATTTGAASPARAGRLGDDGLRRGGAEPAGGLADDEHRKAAEHGGNEGDGSS